MRFLDTAPDGWSPAKLQAFNDVVAACLAHELYRGAAAQLNITSADATKIRTDVAGLIKNQLLPRLLATP